MIVNADILKSQISSALYKLGDYAGAVAKSLREQGIKGERQSCKTCPIAAFLTKKFPGLIFEVGRYRVQTFEPVKPITGYTRPAEFLFEIPLPAACEAFVNDFDNLYKYKDLFQPQRVT